MVDKTNSKESCKIRRHWSPENISFLEDNWGILTIPGIAKKLGRSIPAVKLKASRMRLGRHLHGSCLVSVNQLFRSVYGYDIPNYFYKKLESTGFPFVLRRSIKKRFRMVDIPCFWEWLEKNPTQISIAKLVPGDLGAEPPWATEKRTADIYRAKLKTKGNVPWSRNEDERLKMYLSLRRYSYSDLSGLLFRTENAIRRRIDTLGLRQRPVRSTSRPWSLADLEKIMELNAKGYGNDQIGLMVNRTANSVRGKIDALKNPERSLRKYRNRNKTSLSVERRIL